MNSYYEVIGTLDGQAEVLYGSYLRADCKDELMDERAAYKEEGYTRLTIQSRLTSEAPDPSIY